MTGERAALTVFGDWGSGFPSFPGDEIVSAICEFVLVTGERAAATVFGDLGVSSVRIGGGGAALCFPDDREDERVIFLLDVELSEEEFCCCLNTVSRCSTNFLNFTIKDGRKEISQLSR